MYKQISNPSSATDTTYNAGKAGVLEVKQDGDSYTAAYIKDDKGGKHYLVELNHSNGDVTLEYWPALKAPMWNTKFRLGVCDVNLSLFENAFDEAALFAKGDSFNLQSVLKKQSESKFLKMV